MAQAMVAVDWQPSVSARVSCRPSGVSSRVTVMGMRRSAVLPWSCFSKAWSLLRHRGGGHPVGCYGVALHVVDQKAFQLALGVEIAEPVAGCQGFAGFDGDAVAPHGRHFADAFA